MPKRDHSPKRPRTYTSAWDLHFKKALTRGEYIQLCNALSNALNEHHGVNNKDELICVKPERITEGGWEFSGGPGGVYNSPHFKTMRHSIGSNRTFSSGGWPWVPENALGEWANSTERLIPANYWASTTLKAFNGAPVWTQGELEVFKKVFATFGIKTIGRMPAKARLVDA